ncbi:hypothetical protein SAMD00023519_01425 [Listeria monocytogenes]|nr:hypothetical protein SAMD00023519_01425 [Listeria monocytogenes]
MGEIATFLTLRKKKLPITTLPIFPLKSRTKKMWANSCKTKTITQLL